MGAKRLPRRSYKSLFGLRGIFTFAALFAGIGIITLLITSAATPPMALEPETGTLTGGVTAGTDSNASGGSYISFPSTTPTPPPTGQWQNITPPPPASFNYVAFVNYGAQIITTAPSDPSIVYLGSCLQGIFKTTNGGSTWTKMNTGTNGDKIDAGRNWSLAIDPVNPSIIYSVAGYGPQGLWKSTDGGVNWVQIVQQSLLDQVLYGGGVSHVHIDPANRNHLLIGFHDQFLSGSPGIAESTDGGATWVRRDIPGSSFGGGVFPFFLTSTTWIVGTQDDGYWRTTNSGGTWTKVSSMGVLHGSTQMYKTANGTLYFGGNNWILRSTDGGASFTQVGSAGSGGYHAIMGDGTNLFTMRSLGDTNVSYWTSPETDGTNWTIYNGGTQKFNSGPMSMAYDPVKKILYSSNWHGGVFKLQR